MGSVAPNGGRLCIELLLTIKMNYLNKYKLTANMYFKSKDATLSLNTIFYTTEFLQ